ncbi:MAG: hypothetical protein ACRCYY_13665 [Trueperaceae bacterium]
MKSTRVLAMGELNSIYESSLALYPKLSLRRFCPMADIQYHRLRDFRRTLSHKTQKEQLNVQQVEKIQQTAELHPTYGYRLIHQELSEPV